MKVIVTSRIQNRTYHAKKVEVADGELRMTTNNSLIILDIESWESVEVIEEGDDEDGD